MARKRRVEYEGAIYHAMNRGDRQERVFRDNRDRVRFRGACYRAAGGQAEGRTQGYERWRRDFYMDTKRAEELWVRPLGPGTLKQLQAESLPPQLQGTARPLSGPAPVATDQMESLWDFVRGRLSDPRNPKGVRHPIASVISTAALAVATGCLLKTVLRAIECFLRSGRPVSPKTLS